MFFVVEFEEDNAVEAVPSTWISEDNLTCLWPRKKPENFLENIQDPDFVPPYTWKAWNVKIVKSYDDYETANRKASKFVKSSNVDTTDEDVVRKKRRRQSKKNQPETSFPVPNSSIHLGIPLQNSEHGGGTSLTPFDQTYTSIDISATNSAFIQEEDEYEQPMTSAPSLISNEVFLSSVKSGPNALGANGIAQHNISAHTGNVIPRLDVTTPTSRFGHRVYRRQTPVSYGPQDLPFSEFQSDPIFTTDYMTAVSDNIYSQDLNKKLQKLTDEFKKFQEESLGKQEELKAEIKDLKSLLIKVLSATGKEANCEALRILPITTEEEFFALEQELKSSTNYQQIVAYLSRIGGDSLPKNVYNVMRCAIGKDLSQRLRYTPNSGKTAFGNSLLAKAIREAVFNTPGNKEATADSINTFIGRWFRNSITTKKDGGVKKNKEKKNPESSADVIGSHTEFNSTNSNDSDSNN